MNSSRCKQVQVLKYIGVLKVCRLMPTARCSNYKIQRKSHAKLHITVCN